MTIRRHQGDVLIIGSSFEAALMAAIVARRGCKILWLGGAPESTIPLGKIRAQAGPGLVPALAHAPALTKALREVGLLAEVQRACKPTSLQYLGDRMRISLPSDWLKVPDAEASLRALNESATIADELATVPIQLRWFGRRQFVRRRNEILSRIVEPAGLVGDASTNLNQIFGRCAGSEPSTAQATAAPVDFPGGTLALGQLLQKRCADHHARLFPQGLRQPLPRLNITYRGVEGELASGETLAAHMLVVCLDRDALTPLVPDSVRWTRKVPNVETRPLLRLALHVRRRGIPDALGAFAVIRTKPAFWLERRKIDDATETLTAFWRSDDSAPSAQAERVGARIDEIVPFIERHILAVSGVEPVADHEALEVSHDPLLARRLFFGRGPLLGTGGPEGAAIMAHALAERALKLSGRAPKT